MIDALGENGVRSKGCIGEYHNSVYDLQRQQLQLESTTGTTTLINLDNAGENLLGLLLNDDLSYVDLLYDILGSEVDALERFSGESELIFAIGAEEALVTVGVDGSIRFDNPDHINQLQSEDLLIIQLYLNNDSINVLWEWQASPLYVEKVDPEYPDVWLNWDDYYPSLGDKTLTVRTDFNLDDLKGRTVRAEIIGANSEVRLVVNNQKLTTATAGFIDYNGTTIARFKLSGQNLAPSVPFNPSVDKIEVKFTLLSADGTTEETDVIENWYIKNNSNITLDEVFQGEAVFAYDNNDKKFADDNHKGLSVVGDKFNQVQEMLNQVVPRKRTVLTTDYSYIDTDGIYRGGTEMALKLFKEKFKVENTRYTDKNSFNKLMKDYSQQAKTFYWKNKIIDRETLVGKYHKVTDVAVNVTTNSNDTGLFELYDNVVVPFVDAMIAEAERYTSDEVTQDWIARTGEGGAGASDHGPGMSYCFGCKQDIQTFNSTVVSSCKPEKKADILARETSINNDEYRGNVQNVNGSCEVVITGGLRWAGLYSNELKVWKTANYLSSHPFNPTNYWSGIDCSGFVQRSVNGGRTVVAGTKITIPSTVGAQNANAFFTVPGQVYYKARVTTTSDAHIKQQIKLRKGDLVRYGGHISIVYSTGADEEGGYKIIHAFGTRKSDHDNDEDTDKVFTRKVVITGNKATQKISNPTGYGRIRLWE